MTRLLPEVHYYTIQMLGFWLKHYYITCVCVPLPSAKLITIFILLLHSIFQIIALITQNNV